ncbi:unnamed protein product [Phyllotreta striolata]|uniref:Uncharacterized protein n=1 Tax=Phyllotreta striolata TaxID=444603 RepID=A0A9N9TTF5_PHYSR|nr:unnamed protein product [Phyllotreta striolata]
MSHAGFSREDFSNTGGGGCDKINRYINNNGFNNMEEFNNADESNSMEECNSLEDLRNTEGYNSTEESNHLGDEEEEVAAKDKYSTKNRLWNSNFVDITDANDKKSQYKKNNYKFARNSTGLVTLYITSCEQNSPTRLSIETLKKAVPNLNFDSTIETEYGLIINLQNDIYIQKLLRMDLAKIFQKPVQAVPLFSGNYLKIVSFKQIPWCVRVEEIENCLKNQGIKHGRISREKSTLFIETTDFPNYQRLKEEGINFYNSVMFLASEDTGINDEIHYNSDDIIQCYKCQGFWHTANTCKQNVRCVRCGEQHLVQNCNRPKCSPICCNCKGPHHAAYKLCPVRLKLQKSVRVSFLFDQ